MMKFDFYNNNGAMNSGPVFKAFEDGLIKLGHSIERHTGKGDAAVIWSVLWNGKMQSNKPVWDRYRASGRPVIVLEVGGLRRDHTWKISVNGIGRGHYFVNTPQNSDRRTQLGINLLPWRTTGNNILICSQHDKSLQWDGNPRLSTWVENKILELREYTDRPIVIRPHPRSAFAFDYNRFKVSKSVSTNLYSELKNSWAVVTCNSNPGVEAVIQGIPSLVDSSSLAWPVSIQSAANIENPVLPNREQWLNDLSWTEWTIDEMQKGIPQLHLIDYFQLSKMTGSLTEVI
jgi:hypothetical protein